MKNRDESWALPGLLVGTVGVFALVAGFATGGPDRLDGLVFGGVALAAAAVILWRRSPGRSDPEPRENPEPVHGLPSHETRRGTETDS
jgi:hypothetical protein